MIYERDQVAGAIDAARYRACAGRIDAAVEALHLPSDGGTGTAAQLAAFRLMAAHPDDLSRAFAAGDARRALAGMCASADPGFVDLLTYDGQPDRAASPARAADDSDRVLAEAIGHARGVLDQLLRLATPEGPPPPSQVAALLLAMRVAAEGLSERELATADAETRAALADLGASGAMARLYTYARRAHHLAELAKLGRELLAAATSDVGRG